MTHRTSYNTLDATDYYRKYDKSGVAGSDENNESQSMQGAVVGECYINFSKLL